MPSFKKNNAKQNFNSRDDIDNNEKNKYKRAKAQHDAKKKKGEDSEEPELGDNSNKHANKIKHNEKDKKQGGWRKIPGYDHYEVSSDGKIRSRSHDTGDRTTTGKILSTRETDTGTEIVDLWTDGKRETRVVGEIVAKAWHGDKSGSDDKEAFHKDHNGSNNSSRNIEWKSRSDINKDISESKSVIRTLLDNDLI